MKNFNLEIFTRILLFFKLYLYWFINSRFQNSINYNLNISKSRTSFNVKKLSVYKKFEGISLKRFIILALSKISNLKKIKINFIQLNRPNKKAYAFFNTLKRNVKARGPFKKEVFKIFIILYQSVLFKSPKMFGFYMMSLIKKNIKKVRPLFTILSLLLPSFCSVLQLQGLSIQLKGRINGSKRTRIIKIQHGQIPLTTIKSNICYSFNKVMTIHGIYGLRVWFVY